MNRKEFEALLALEGFELEVKKDQCFTGKYRDVSKNEKRGVFVYLWIAYIRRKGNTWDLPLFAWGVKRNTAVRRAMRLFERSRR